MATSKLNNKQAQLEQRIREAITGLLPLVRLEQSDVVLVAFEVETGIATLRLSGDCPDCEMSARTLLQGIEAHLKQRVPEIRAVRVTESSVA